MLSPLFRIHVYVAVLFTFLLVCVGPATAENVHKPITQKLILMLEQNPDLKEMLKTSLAECKKVNPDPTTNPVQSLQEYYDYVDETSELIPQVVMLHPECLIRDQILECICYFYFLVDQPIAALKDKGLFNNTLQYDPTFSKWLREFADAWGEYLATEASWTQETFEEFKNEPRFGFQNGWYGDKNTWKTFNEFFSRHLVSPSMRPIASPGDNKIVVSPADSVPQGVWSVDEKSNIHVDDGLKVKLIRYFNVNELIGKDSKYKDAFAGGVLTHNFLNVNDYHRYHFAVSGVVKEVSIISQNVSLEVAWNPKTKRYDPIDSLGWQFSQTRGVVIVDTGEQGLVALIPMGMAQVSSVNFEDDVQIGSRHRKGDMLGTFLFGGSDFVIVFQKKAGFVLTTPKELHSSEYKHRIMGQSLGQMGSE